VLGLCLGIQYMVCPGVLLACVDCHKEVEPIAGGKMAEQIQEIGKRHDDFGGCVVCHGGDPLAEDKESAHQGTPLRLMEVGGPKSFYRDPGDIRVASRTCGQCHEGYEERLRKSVMSTGADAIGRNLCAAAWEKRRKQGGTTRAFGRYRIVDEDGPEPSAGSRVYKSLMRSLRTTLPEDFPDHLMPIPANVLEEAGGDFPAACKSCHADDAQNRPRIGCSTCHIPYVAHEGSEPAVDRAEPKASAVHRIQGCSDTSIGLRNDVGETRCAIPRETCFQCHFDPRVVSVNKIGDAFVHYGGGREGKGGGLLCQDCHTSIEMHGDGNIAAVSAAQNEVRCEDCHGTSTHLPWELPLVYVSAKGARIPTLQPRGTGKNDDVAPGITHPAEDGYLLTSRGNPFGNVIREGKRVVLYSAAGRKYDVPLLKQVVVDDASRSQPTKPAMCVDDTHPDMTCLDCHADWLPSCPGCHAENS
jgi:hypothetical protein